MADVHDDRDSQRSKLREQTDDTTEEVLLADLTDPEEADRLFEGFVDRNTALEQILGKLKTAIALDGVTGGDLDDDWYQAEVVGEEAVGGQNPTPDQNVTEDLLRSTGLSSVDGEPVRTREKLEWRDHKRWELDPASSDDYQERF